MSVKACVEAMAWVRIKGLCEQNAQRLVCGVKACVCNGLCAHKGICTSCVCEGLQSMCKEACVYTNP